MEPNDASSTSARAQELRASLSARREVEALLAEASATREAAVSDADAIIEEAQQVSEQLLRESRTEAERTSSDARSRAEGLVARARAEAEDITRQARAAADAVRARAEAQVEEHRRRVRAELTEQVTREVAEQSRRELARVQEQQEAMIGDLEASVRILGVSMEAAAGNIAEMLGALDSLRTHSAESLGDATTRVNGTRHPVDATGDDAAREHGFEAGLESTHHDDDHDAVHDVRAADEADDEEEDDPREGAARASRSGHLIDVLAELDGSVGAGDDPGYDDDPPLTATEAFLRSSHLDHGDPPLPVADDSEVGVRYARDAMRATARARSRRDEETLEIAPARDAGTRQRRNGKPGPDERASEDDGESPGKPLGWLFRSSSQ